MPNSIFNTVLQMPDTITVIEVSDFFLCAITAILLGIFTACMYSYKTKCTKGFVLSLAVLPLAIAIVIMMVNGSIGAGVAVAGAFSLVRFRSVPGTAKEISAIFITMCTGLVIGMGYIAYAALFAVIASIFSMVLSISQFGNPKTGNRVLNITIPESLNYTEVFDDIMKKFTSDCDLISAKTVSMGSLFKLRYELELKDPAFEKEFVDELRCRNGNLEIIISKEDAFLNGL